MRKDRNFGILLASILLLPGAYLLYESTAHSDWYVEVYLFVGATMLAVGLMTLSWAIQRHGSIRRLEQHLRGHQ